MSSQSSSDSESNMNVNHHHLPLLPPASSLILNENRVNHATAPTNTQTPQFPHVLDSASNQLNGHGSPSSSSSNSVSAVSSGSANSNVGASTPANQHLHSAVFLPPISNSYHYAVPADHIASQYNFASPTASNLPPLFRLVLDSTLPVTNQPTNTAAPTQPTQNISSSAAAAAAAAQYTAYPTYKTSSTAASPAPVVGSPSYPTMRSGTVSLIPTFNGCKPATTMSAALGDYQSSPDSSRNSSFDHQKRQVKKRRPSSSPHSRSPSAPSTQPRKKRECPVCHNFFSNLTTHRTIHNKDSKPFSCPTCSRSFKRLNDLIRHEKCHLSKLGEWEFQCPFYNPSVSEDSVPSPTDPTDEKKFDNCHHTGFFTRCDTYKNHLKAIHFRYPPNTLKSERARVSGNCKECGMFFQNVQDWLVNHVENGACPKIVCLAEGHSFNGGIAK